MEIDQKYHGLGIGKVDGVAAAVAIEPQPV
jgi:hypothetical protein